VLLIKLKPILAFLKALGPYAAIELILPGGTILAILLWLYRRRRAAKARTAFSLQSAPGAHIALQISHEACVWAPYQPSSASSSAS
jgi:hypothetical protein